MKNIRFVHPLLGLGAAAVFALGSLSAANSAQLIPVHTYPVHAATPQPVPVTTAPAAPAHAGTIWTGRMLDLQGGFAFFSTGDSFHIASDAPVTDIQTGKPFAGDNVTGLYGRATFSAKGIITALAVSHKAMPLDPPEPVRQYAVALSAPVQNPELTGAEGFTGAPVLVSFTVQVPITTNITDSVYMSTEASHWDPMETRMDRVDALHYRITRYIASGTHVVYRYTRGTWRSAERGRDGLEGPPHTFIVRNLDVAHRDDTVYHWSDESVSGETTPISPDSLPTPFGGGGPFMKAHP